MSQEQPHIVEAVPGIKTSTGHERRTQLTMAALSEIGLPREQITLSTKNGIGGVLWHVIDEGKGKLAAQSRQGQSSNGSFIDTLAARGRSSKLASHILLRDYHQQLSQMDRGVLLSTHYMTFLGEPDDNLRIMVTPDLFPQRQVAQMSKDTQLWSDSPVTTTLLRELGIDDSRIHEVPLLLPSNIYSGMAERGSIQQRNVEKQRLRLWDRVEHQALVTVGASNPEYNHALEKIAQLNQIPSVKQVHIICGEGTNDINCQFKQEVKALPDPQRKMCVLGGEKGWERQHNTKAIFMALSNPEVTISVSRPNEMTKIAAAIGMWQLPLLAYQDHEQNVLNRIMESIHLHRSNILYLPKGMNFIPGIYTDTFGPENNFWMPKAIGLKEFQQTQLGQMITSF